MASRKCPALVTLILASMAKVMFVNKLATLPWRVEIQLLTFLTPWHQTQPAGKAPRTSWTVLTNFTVFCLPVMHNHNSSLTKCFLIAHTQHTISNNIHNPFSTQISLLTRLDTCTVGTISCATHTLLSHNTVQSTVVLQALLPETSQNVVKQETKHCQHLPTTCHAHQLY